MPAQVKKHLKALRAKFFWGSSENKKKLAWVNWNMVMSSKEKGGSWSWEPNGP